MANETTPGEPRGSGAGTWFVVFLILAVLVIGLVASGVFSQNRDNQPQDINIELQGDVVPNGDQGGEDGNY